MGSGSDEPKDDAPTRADGPASPGGLPLGDAVPTRSFVASDGPLPEGARVGRYLVLDVIGVGGMGRVYKAYDPQLDRKVALKLMLGVGDPLARQRLLREAKAMARLSHPNVVAVHDAGEAGDQVFVAMDYVEGSTLSQWLKAAARDAATILGVFRQAGAGLEAAHRAALVHRDFKPANVLLGADGRVCVTDFGLAREAALRGDDPTPAGPALFGHGDSGSLERLTQVGVVAGTPHYMAPELFAGKEADARADQFAFCVALWESLYGQEPFPAETVAERARKVSKFELTQPAERRGVPRYVHRALERGLSPRPEQRHRSMGALLQALSRDTRPGVRWAPLGLALAAVLTVGALGYWRVTSARNRACAEALQSFQLVWTPAAQQRAQDAYLAALPASGPTGWARVEAELGLWHSGWLEAHAGACGPRGPARLDARLERTLACLDGLRTQAHVLVGALTAVDQTSALAANEAVAALGLPRECASSAAPGGAEGAAARQVRALLGEAAMLNVLGKGPEGQARALEAGRLANQSGLVADEARAALALATSRVQLSKLEEADQASIDALVAAQRSGDPGLLAAAWSERMSHAALYQGRYAQALEYGRLSEAALSLAGGNPEVEARLAANRGFVLLQTGNPGAALKALEEAAALQRKRGLSNMYGVRTLLLLANAQRGAGRPAAALETLDALDAIQARLLPDLHPSIAAALNARGRVLLSQADAGAALEAHRRALAIQEKTMTAPNGEMVKTLAMIAEAERAAGRPDDASLTFRRALEQALGLFPPEHPVRAALERDLGGLALEGGRHAEAARALAAALAGSWPAPERARLGAGLAEAQLALGAFADAAKSAEGALAHADLPSARFTLARALAGQRQKPRALEEAQRARAQAEPALAARIDAFLEAQSPKRKKRR